MSLIDYKEYLQSEAWKQRRKRALLRSALASVLGRPCCEECGMHGLDYKTRWSDLDWSERQLRVEYANGLQVHHLHYRTLGDEGPDDLIVLCTNSLFLGRVGVEGCHERVHSDRYFRRVVQQTAAGRCY